MLKPLFSMNERYCARYAMIEILNGGHLLAEQEKEEKEEVEEEEAG